MATNISKEVLMMILVGLPLITPCLVWLLGLSVSYVREKATASWLIATLFTLLVAGVAVAGVPWAIFYSHVTYNWFVGQWFLLLVGPLALILLISYVVGEERRTLSDVLRVIVEAIDP